MAHTDNRQRILQFIRRTGEASLSELGQGLGLSHVTVRRHLGELVHAGIVAPPEQRRRGGPGRPELVYSVTATAEELLPANYEDLARAVLGALDAKQGPEWVRKLMREAGSRAATAFAADLQPVQGGLIPRLLAGLENRGYLPAIGTWSGRRCLTFSHCPYVRAAGAFQVVCAFDQGLLEAILGEPVILFRQIVEKDPQCMFLLGA